ncbi:rab guanine nucleotide exchange factor S2 [Gnomoniopsis smithogilvyi]|uniref:Rab guanine nucleotide exchange factor S2 n=1 Tax=Gnomoniopsis smithogilvyi TaxID=1191159 RepID=A0A9W8YME3_9PEZI|nr:rab guanine nucleotide exchange factor S2 [Gnomoniopsis smithogilvyi]
MAQVYSTNHSTWRSLISAASGWSQYHHSPAPSSAPTSRQPSRIRSHSNLADSSASSLSAATTKPRSNTHASIMADEISAALATPPQQRVFAGISENDFDMTTIPDPRSRSMTPALDGSPSPPEQHPELSDEVAALSSKLIHAINHQTTLDDNLSQTRAELEKSREQIRSMELQLAKHKEMLVGDIWIRRKSAEIEKTNLLSRIAEENRHRLEAEQEKKRIEQELENLTQELFEEANKMVISAKEEARKEQEIVHRKNDLLRAQLADTEGLLKSQQEQLAELKRVMEQMQADRDDQTATTTPSSPGYSKFDAQEDDTPTSDIGSQSGLSDLITPSYPTSFTHLLQPVLRNDISAYQDFANLCETSRRVASRPPSGSHSSLGLSLIGSGASVASVGIPSTASTASLSSVGSPAASSTFSPATPNTPASNHSSMSAMPMMPIPPLKETKFYKRVLVEDVEPTLRLDIAPGLSWLARRSVVTAMSDGSLVVEPVPTTGTYALLSKPQLYPCSLCGENRKDDQYLRRYRFRTSESSSAQRYPLCRYCLNRVRATCDFLGFLRIVKDGHWRTDDDDAEKAAWEESVRLRENMFWTRIGGGVRPIAQGFHNHSHSIIDRSPRTSREDAKRPVEISVEPIMPMKQVCQPMEAKAEDDMDDEFATPREESIPETSPNVQLDETDNTSDNKSVVIHVEAPETIDKEMLQAKVDTIPDPPRTPPPTDENRLSSQSLTPKSSESDRKITVTIPSDST